MQPKRERIPVRDANWKESFIIRVTPNIRADTLEGAGSYAGLASLFTETGERVNQLPDGSYQEVNSDRRYWDITAE